MWLFVVISVVLRNNKHMSYVSFWALFFFSLCRGDDVGVDTKGAMSAVAVRANMMFSLDSSMSLEFISNLIPYCAFNGWVSDRAVITFYTIAMFLALFVLQKKMKLNMAILMLVFFLAGHYIYSFNIARQWTAICVVSCALPFIFEKNKLKSLYFFPIILLATGIHASSPIFLPLYLFRYVDFSLHRISWVWYITAFLGMTEIFTLSIILDKFSFISYAETYSDNIREGSQMNFFGKLGLSISSFLSIYALYKLGDGNKFKLIFLSCICLGFLSIGLESVIARALQGFSFLASVCLCLYFSRYNKKNYLLIIYVIYASFMFFRYGIRDPYDFRFHDLI